MWAVSSISTGTYDERNRRLDTTIIKPRGDQVQDFIKQMDGHKYTEMDIVGSNRHSMVIGGGPDHYVVTVIGDDLGPYELLGDDQTDEMIKIIIGGVITEMPRRFLVAYAQTLQAANFFYENGSLDPSLHWHLD